MTARSRSYDNRANFTGTYQNLILGSTTTRSLATGLNGTCDDTIGNFPKSNGLSLTVLNRQYPGLVGERINATTGVLERKFNNFPIGYHPGPTDPRSVFPALTSLEKSNYAWSILSKANPSAPDVSLPTVLAEMRDIPSLLKNWYGLFLRRKWQFATKKTPKHWVTMLQRLPEIIASGHLTWRWAIAPFIRDIRKMCDFAYLMNKRLAELRKLQNGQVLHRKVALANNTEKSSTKNVILHSEGGILKGDRNVTYTEKVWGSVRYRVPAGGELYKQSNDRLILLAKHLTYGINSREAFATAWELMPWSWFVDWFLGVGTIINATNNTLGLVHSDCCLMRHTTSVATIWVNPASSESWISQNREFYESYERKERFVVAPLLPFAPSYLPLASAKAVSILGSLAILQLRPGRNLNAFFRK